MATKQLTILVILFIVKFSTQDVSDNKIEDNDVNPFEEAKAAIMKEQNLQNIGSLLNNFIQSDGAKHLGDMIANAATGEKGGDLLQGLGSMLNNGQGLDPSLLGLAMNMFAQSQGQKQKDSDDGGFDLNSMMSLLGAFSGQGAEKPNLLTLLPMVAQTINAFLGPEAEAREKVHSGHSNMMPPMLERVHVLFDHFMNSDLGRLVVNTIGGEKFMKMFADENGKMSYKRLVDRLENHSFRKYWISMLTEKIAMILSHVSDPRTQKKYLTTFQHFLNSVLKTQKFPKMALFDHNRPVETLSNMINFIIKDYFKMKIDSREYVQPAVEYVQELFSLSAKNGASARDHQELSDKLADTINLEIIEPVVRANRAYRFALKVPTCDRYVICLVNREPEHYKPSLPGLRPLLSKSSSFVFSWMLSTHSGTPFWSLYHDVMSNENCKSLYKTECNDFHIEEEKVTQKFEHTEL